MIHLEMLPMCYIFQWHSGIMSLIPDIGRILAGVKMKNEQR